MTMDHLKDGIREILDNVNAVVDDLDEDAVEGFLDAIEAADHIFLHGAGRSGLVAQSFGMRLMHLDQKISIVGEVTAPPIEPDDLLICISGSGQTSSVLSVARTADDIGGAVYAITGDLDSDLATLADGAIRIDSQIELRQEQEHEADGSATGDGERDYLARAAGGSYSPLTPMGTLFEDAAMLFLDGVVVELMHRFDRSEEEMEELHTNLE
ncbi:MAG: SIS domain-containing protein [Candidatus Nanohaloarchaea archaeon]